MELAQLAGNSTDALLRPNFLQRFQVVSSDGDKVRRAGDRLTVGENFTSVLVGRRSTFQPLLDATFLEGVQHLQKAALLEGARTKALRGRRKARLAWGPKPQEAT